MEPLWRGWGPAGLDILPLPTFVQHFLLVLLACPSPLGAPPALHTCQGLAPCLPEEGQVNTSGPRLLLATLHPASGSSAAMDRIVSALLLSLLLLLQSYGVCGAPPQPRGKWGAQRRDARCPSSTSLPPACFGTGKEMKEEEIPNTSQGGKGAFSNIFPRQQNLDMCLLLPVTVL